jgi:DNA-binding HxlR family transcriptional regulator
MTHGKAQALLEGWQLGNVLAADCPSRVILNHMTNRWGTLVMVVLGSANGCCRRR